MHLNILFNQNIFHKIFHFFYKILFWKEGMKMLKYFKI